MKAQLWSLSGLSTELGMDRRSLERKLTGLVADSSENKGGKVYNKYYMARVVAHLMGGEAMDYASERTRLTKEQADKTEMENAVNRGELVEASVILKLAGDHIHAAKTKLLGIPSQISTYLANKDAQDVQIQLTDAIHDCLTDLSCGAGNQLDTAKKVNGKSMGG